jgi:hypothetical protein
MISGITPPRVFEPKPLLREVFPMTPFFHWLRDFVTNPVFQWAAFIVGVLGAAIATYALLESRKKDRIRDYLFELAEKNLDKKITEEQLAERKREVKEASDRIESLQKRIEREIPLEAKRTVLKDRLDMNISALHQTLLAVRALKQDLEGLGSSSDIPPDLLKSVEREISPEYLITAKRESLKTYLTIVMTASAVLSSAVPFYEIRLLIQTPLLLLGAFILLALAKVSLPKQRSKEHRVMLQVLWVSLSIVGTIVSALLLLAAFVIWKHDREPSLIMGGIALLVIGLTAFLVSRIWAKQKVVQAISASSDTDAGGPVGKNAQPAPQSETPK